MPERFGQISSLELNQAFIDFSVKKNGNTKIVTVDLSTFLSRKRPTLYTGTVNGFYAHDPLMVGRSPQDFPFNVIGIQVDELKENMSRLSAIWHENGHVLIFLRNLDTQLLKAALTLKGGDLPPVAKAQKYAQVLAQSIPNDQRNQLVKQYLDRELLSVLEARFPLVNKSVSLFHERNAWAAGAWMVLLKELPTGFSNPSSYFEYARLCLGTYAKYNRDSKFVSGWK